MPDKITQPRPIDIHIGRRVKTRRVMREMNRTKLAERLGLTYQQLRKHENGENRISASRLWLIAQILDVPVAWFFEELDNQPTDVDVSMASENLEFASAVQGLSADLRKSIQQALKAIGDTTA